MPILDFSRVINNPYFSTTFDVIRTAMVVGNDGRNTPTVSTFFGIVGVVTPANSSDIQRLPDLERLSGAISVVTGFRLIDLRSGYSPDMVVWPAQGVWPPTTDGSPFDVYSVDMLDDWSQFGSGFTKATCRLNTLT